MRLLFFGLILFDSSALGLEPATSDVVVIHTGGRLSLMRNLNFCPKYSVKAALGSAKQIVHYHIFTQEINDSPFHNYL